MEGQGKGSFVFLRKGLGLQGTEVIPGKLAALLFVSQEQGESGVAKMLLAELVQCALTFHYPQDNAPQPPPGFDLPQSQHKAKTPQKGTC